MLKLTMTNANYIDLVSKEGSQTSIKIMELLSKIEEESQGIFGKKLICIYGDTGAGKSTYTNYLIGVPMKLFKDDYNQWSV